MNGAYEVLVYANNVNLWAENIRTAEKIPNLYSSNPVVL